MSFCESAGSWAASLGLGDVPERVRERARLQTESILAAGRAGAAAAAPMAAVAPEGRLGEVYTGAAASIAHDWDDYLFMGHTGHSSVWVARAFAEDADTALRAQIAGNEVAGNEVRAESEQLRRQRKEAEEDLAQLQRLRLRCRELFAFAPDAWVVTDLQGIIEEADRLSKTVARYLQFARVGEEPRQGGDAATALQATLDLLEGELGARGVMLERAGGLTAAPVGLDNESLKQVYLNLILNALEAMPAGGRLRIGEAERHGRIEVSIADEGAGIPPDVLRRVGSPFYTTKAQGSGLGLFLARRLVRASGGDLHIQSLEGRGTTCTVRLPRRRA